MFFMMFLNLISFCRDLVSGSNDVSALKSKFVWLIVPPPRPQISVVTPDEVSTRGQLPFNEFTCR